MFSRTASSEFAQNICGNLWTTVEKSPVNRDPFHAPQVAMVISLSHEKRFFVAGSSACVYQRQKRNRGAIIILWPILGLCSALSRAKLIGQFADSRRKLVILIHSIRAVGPLFLKFMLLVE